MLSRGATRVLVVALVLATGAAALLLHSAFDADVPVAEVGAAPTESEREVAYGAEPARLAVPPEADEPAPGAAPSEESPPDAVEARPPSRLDLPWSGPTGALRGRLMDALGEPIAGHRLKLAEDGDLGFAGLRMTSDADGFFGRAEVPVGTWIVAYFGPPERGWDSAGAAVGTVTIEEGLETRFDVVLKGERSVRGKLEANFEGTRDEAGDLVPEEGFCLVVEVVSLRVPGEVVASSLTCTSPEERPDESGRFHFEGLAADTYVLRVWADVDKTVAWQQEIDLTGGDVELPPKLFSMGDFEPLRR